MIPFPPECFFRHIYYAIYKYLIAFSLIFLQDDWVGYEFFPVKTRQVVNACNPRTQDQEQKDYEFEAILGLHNETLQEAEAGKFLGV